MIEVSFIQIGLLGICTAVSLVAGAVFANLYKRQLEYSENLEKLICNKCHIRLNDYLRSKLIEDIRDDDSF